MIEFGVDGLCRFYPIPEDVYSIFLQVVTHFEQKVNIEQIFVNPTHDVKNNWVCLDSHFFKYYFACIINTFSINFSSF